jgi:dihydrodipicolinate synthase/N-acetylneuraminate lyase
MTQPFRGIFSIAQTPFADSGEILWEDFEFECDWIVRTGTHGFVYPVMVSEFTVLSYPERVQAMNVAVRAVAGRIPVVIGVADTSTDGAARLAEEAAKAGADAVIAMPPWGTKLTSNDLIEGYYRALAEAAELPIFIQNAGPPLGSSLPGAFVVELCERIELVQYLKEEKPPQGQSLSKVLELCGPGTKGIFSGGNCRYLISEYGRGVAGSMPPSHVADLDAQVWDLLEAGDKVQAREIHNAKLILENAIMGLPGGVMACKEVLVRRGVLSNSAVRGGGALRLDAHDRAALDYALGLVEPYFRVRPA